MNIISISETIYALFLGCVSSLFRDSTVLIPYTELVIGFISPEYGVSESDEFVTLQFGILNGSMTQTTVIIELLLSNLTFTSR